MPSIFTRIINGELPGRFVWNDETAVSFLPLQFLSRGHVLVVPRLEVDQWTELPPDVIAHLAVVAQTIGQAQMAVFSPARIGLMIVGFDVPHVHLHVTPADGLHHFDFAAADGTPDAADADSICTALRGELRARGHGESVPD